jgi:hypothetical protein
MKTVTSPGDEAAASRFFMFAGFVDSFLKKFFRSSLRRAILNVVVARQEGEEIF